MSKIQGSIRTYGGPKEELISNAERTILKKRQYNNYEADQQSSETTKTGFNNNKSKSKRTRFQ